VLLSYFSRWYMKTKKLKEMNDSGKLKHAYVFKNCSAKNYRNSSTQIRDRRRQILVFLQHSSIVVWHRGTKATTRHSEGYNANAIYPTLYSLAAPLFCWRRKCKLAITVDGVQNEQNLSHGVERPIAAVFRHVKLNLSDTARKSI